MIPLPSKPKVSEKTDNRAIFEIAGLYPGYGVTLGNALRRVLLSSLEGAAITQVKIKNAPHEFSALSGVLEDVVMILLNVKKLSFRSFSDEPQTINLKVKGEKEVKAKDFKLTSELKLSDPDAHIATLTKPTADLEIEALVEKGVGYEPIERRERAKAEVGALPLDAFFTPVRKVSFTVESMRVGKRTDFDRLKIELETNGVLTPEEAFKKAADILVAQFSLLIEAFSQAEEKKSETKPKAKAKKAVMPAKKPAVKKEKTKAKAKKPAKEKSVKKQKK